MAEAGRRRLSKSLFQIVALLFLAHIGQSLMFGDYRLRNEFVKGWKAQKTFVTQLTEVKSGTKSILTLLEEAKSLANMKDLGIFHQYLQAAVDEVNKQKVEKLSDVTLEMQDLHKILDDPDLLQKSPFFHSLLRRLIKATEQRLEVYGIYLELKKDAFNGKLEDTDEELTYTLHKIKSWKKIHHLFEIIPILFFSALALYWICSCICSCIFSYL